MRNWNVLAGAAIERRRSPGKLAGPRWVLRLMLLLTLMACGSSAYALPFECIVLHAPDRPFVRIVRGATPAEANAAFIQAYGSEVRRSYGPNVRFKCSYPPSAGSLASVPGKNSPYPACPSGKTRAETKADVQEALEHDCGEPLNFADQFYVASYWTAAREQCRYAMAPEQFVFLMSVTSYVANITNVKDIPIYQAAVAQVKEDGCTPHTRRVAESFVRYLVRTGDPAAERPFIATCLQRPNMDVRKCRCYGDAIRVVDSRAFHRIYDGPAYGQIVPHVGPLWEAQLSAMCMGVRPN